MSILVESLWPSVRLKFLGRFKGGSGFPHDEQGIQSAELPFYKVKDLGQSASDAVLRETENYVDQETAEDLGAFIFPSGSIVFAKVGAALLLSRFRVLSRPACIDNNMMGFMPNTQICDIAFTLSALNLLNFASLVNPGAVPSLNEEQIAEQKLPLPPLPTQHAIANFLDRETSKLDSLIAAKEQLLALLSEKRRALITHAVSRGINPNASLRDSGIPWLGKIPAHWAVKKLKYTSTINDETLSESTSPTYEFLYVDIGNVEYLKGICSKESFMFENAPSRARRIVRKGDTIVSTVRTYLRAIAPISQSEDNLIVSTGFAVVRPRGIDSNYLSYALRSTYFVETIVSRSTGVSYPAINASELGTIPICLPPLQEQRAIVSHIAMETKKLDALRAAAERTIALSKERRAALIAAAVTGKIEVAAGGLRKA